MLRTRRAILILVAYWLAIFAGPAASAALHCAPSHAAAATAVTAAACPMEPAQKSAPAACCCCDADARSATHSLTAPSDDPCACSMAPAVPVEYPDAAPVAPLLSAVALLPRPAALFALPRLDAAPQAPIRGPSTAPPLSPPLAPDAGRAPPAA